MVFSSLKARNRRRRLAQRGVAPEIRRETARYGARSGVWTVATRGLGPDSVVYAFGVGDNLAWELAMIERHGVTVHAFDPTPRSVAWVRRQDLPDRLVFAPVGLAEHDGELELFAPRRATSKNYSVLAPRGRSDGGAGERVACPVARLGTLARERGHGRIDVLKMDIEGAEATALPDLLRSGPAVGQLLVELHYGHPDVTLDEAVALVHDARAKGFRVLDVSPRGYELTLVHEDWPWA